MLNIVIPMAGLGSRFSAAGYEQPKPLIPVHGVPMIRLVIENIRPRREHRFIFICQQEHIKSYALREKLNAWSPGCEIVGLEGITQGAACTVLHALPLIDNTAPMLIANSDQYVETQIDHYLQAADQEKLDGLIMTMKADDPKWSFVGLDPNGSVQRVVEKEVISDRATVGIYHFKRGCDFVKSASEMIAKQIRVNGEFYVAPVYNEMIAKGANIGYFDIGSVDRGMYGLGTPSDLESFLKLPLSTQAAARFA